MRIAYLVADPGVPVAGRKGASVHVQSVVRALARRGAEVELFASRIGGDPGTELAGIPIQALPLVAGDEPAGREHSALAANAGVLSALARRGPFDLVYERHALWGFAGMEHAKAAGVPGLLEVNAPLIEEQATHRVLIDRAGAERAAAKSFAAASQLLAVSDGVAEYLESHPAARGRVHVVPNGVDPDRFAPGAYAAATTPGPFTVGFVGTLKAWHGTEILVEAFAILHERDPRVRLLLVGDGPERPRIEALLATRGLTGAAVLTGAVEPARVPALLAAMDVAVAPYPDRERFYFSPLKLYEYMAAGRAVVASRVGQIADVIQDGRSGLLCSPGDPHALAGALARAYADPDLRARLGRAARERVLQRHTWDAVAERVLALAREPASLKGR